MYPLFQASFAFLFAPITNVASTGHVYAPCTHQLCPRPPPHSSLFPFFRPLPQLLTIFLYRLFQKCCLRPSVTRLPSTSSIYHYQTCTRPITLISSCRKDPNCSSSTAIVTFSPRPAHSPSSTPLPRRTYRLLAFPQSTTCSAEMCGIS